MKKKITFAAQCTLTVLLLACSASSTDKANDKASANEVNHSNTTVIELTEDRFQALVRNLPDHVLEVSDQYYTQEYCKTFAEALRLPSGESGYIGNNEFLYYFVCGNDPCDTHSGKLQSLEIVQDTAIVHFDIIHRDAVTTPSTLRLVIKDGEWVIADFNETLSQMKKYIKEQKEYNSVPQNGM